MACVQNTGVTADPAMSDAVRITVQQSQRKTTHTKNLENDSTSILSRSLLYTLHRLNIKMLQKVLHSDDVEEPFLVS